MSPDRHYGQELRIGSLGVPLAVAGDLHRRVIINREPPKKVYESLGLSVDVGRKIVGLLRRHKVPSKERLILLSIGYPERTHADIASAFGVTVDKVMECERQAANLRRAEPLSTERWEDYEDGDISPDEIAERAAEVRRTNLELVKEEVSGRSGDRPQGGTSMGGSGPHRPWARYCSRQEARPPGTQSAKGFLPHAGRGGGSGNRNQAPQPQVFKPK